MARSFPKAGVKWRAMMTRRTRRMVKESRLTKVAAVEVPVMEWVVVGRHPSLRVLVDVAVLVVIVVALPGKGRRVYLHRNGRVWMFTSPWPV